MTDHDPLEIRALADVLHSSGETYRKEGDFVRAAEFLRKSLEIRERTGDIAPIATARAELAAVLVLLGEMETAIDLAERALAALDELGDAKGVAGCHDLLGNIARCNFSCGMTCST